MIHNVSSRTNTNTENNSILLNKLFTLTIILCPILRQYVSGIPGVTLADLILAIFGLILLFNPEFRLLLNKVTPLLLLWLFGIMISLFSYLTQQTLDSRVFSRIIRYSFYVIMIPVSTNNFQIKYGLKILKYLSICISIYIIFQITSYQLFRIVLPFKIIPIPLERDIDIEYMAQFALNYYYRPTGIFVEPGYAAQFLLPGLTFSLYGWGNKKVELRSTLIILFAILITTSSQGIFLSIVTITLFIVSKMEFNKDRNKAIKNIILLVMLSVLILFFLNLDNVQFAFNKVTGNIRAGSSVALRVYRGFAVFSQLPLFYKIIGVGHGNLGNFVIKNGIVTKYDSTFITYKTADYASGASTVLLYYGIIGFILLIILYINLVRNTKGSFRLVAINFILLSFVANISYDILIIYFLSFIYADFLIHDNDKLNV